MKFVVFGERCRLGLLQANRVLDLALAEAGHGAAGPSCLSSLQALIDAGPRGLELVRECAERLRGSDQPNLWQDVSQVRLRPPWPGQRFFLIGSNSVEHVVAAFTNMGTPRTAEEVLETSRKGVPSGFWGMARPLVASGEQVTVPARANGLLDFEAEPCIVLGKQGKNIKAKDVADYIWGVTMVNDWSIREGVWPQKPHPPFMPSKNFDQSKSFGPCIVVGELDPNDFAVEGYVNGVQRQAFSTRDMIFSFGEILEHFSRDFTWFPGDAISGGTGTGTGIDQTRPNADGSWPRTLFLKPGDTVEIRSAGIGSLVNQVVA